MDKLEDVQLEKIEEQIENEQRSVKYLSLDEEMER